MSTTMPSSLSTASRSFSSFYLPTADTDPTDISAEPFPSLNIDIPLKPDKSCYSFVWSLSPDSCLETDDAIETLEDLSGSQKIPKNNNKLPMPVRTEKRCEIPNLPLPV